MEPNERRRPIRGLTLANPEFSRLTSVHMLNAAAEAFIAVALAKSLFFSVSVSTARSKIALSLMFTMLPFSIVAPFLGPAMDRFPRLRRNMLLISTAGRAVTCAFMTKYLNSFLLFPLAFVTVVLSRSYGVAKSALVPSTVADENELVEANSKLTISSTIAGLFALLVGTALSSALGASRWSLWFAGVVFIIAFCAATTLRPGEVADGRLKQAKDATVPPSIPLAITVMATLRALVGFVSFLVIFYMREQHYPAWKFGVILVVSMSGAFFGALIAPPLRKRFQEERIIEGALAGVFLCTVTGLYIEGLTGTMLFTFSIGVAAHAAKVAFDSLVQRDAPAGSHGTTFARFEAALQIMWVIGAFAAVLFEMSINTGMIWVAFTAIVVAIVYAMGGYTVVVKAFHEARHRYAENRAARLKEKEAAEVISADPEVIPAEAGIHEEAVELPEPQWGANLDDDDTQ